MTRVTQPIPASTPPEHEAFDARARLDALSTGACEQGAFLKEVNEVLRTDPDEGWELLSLIDQYYRRGKLNAGLFRALNAHLQALLMGTARSGVERSDAPPRFTAPAAAAPESPSMPAPSFAAAQSSPAGAAADSDPAPVMAELLRGRYRMLGVIGQGAIGTVFEAVDEFRTELPGENRKVAVKVLHPVIAQRAELLAELRREFQQLQSLSHPNIVRVHEFDRDGGTVFFTMECLGGSLLSRVLAVREAAALLRPHALKILRDVGGALAHAHARGVVHGDLDPGNIFVTDGGDIRVLNCGVSYKLHHGPGISQTEAAQDFADAGSIYASCQVLEGEPAEVRDDLYAFGCTAYFLLTGEHPYQQYTALKARTLRLAPERPGGLTRRQWQTLRAALSFERELRPASMQDWLEQFDLKRSVQRLPSLPALMTAREHRGREWWLGAGAAAALVLLGVVGWWSTQHADRVEAEARALADRVWPLFDTARKAVATSWDKARRPDSNSARPPSAVTAVPAKRPSARAVANARVAPVAPGAPMPRAPVPGPPARVPLAGAPSAPTPSATPPSATAAAVPAGPASAASAASSTAPHSRIELVTDTVAVAPGESVARVAVRRIGSWRGVVTFNWWTESGTAQPKRDFVAVKPQPEELGDGKGAISLTVPLIADAARTGERSFYVMIDDASPNATLGSRTLTMVTIPAPP